MVWRLVEMRMETISISLLRMLWRTVLLEGIRERGVQEVDEEVAK
jgi:hypothetical protein